MLFTGRLLAAATKREAVRFVPCSIAVIPLVACYRTYIQPNRVKIRRKTPRTKAFQVEPRA